MIYADDKIPTGPPRLKIARGGGDGISVGSFIMESADIERPGNRSGEAVLQMDFTSPQPGDWFSGGDFIPGEKGFGRWVITEVLQHTAPAGYRRANIKFHRAPRNGLSE